MYGLTVGFIFERFYIRYLCMYACVYIINGGKTLVKEGNVHLSISISKKARSLLKQQCDKQGDMSAIIEHLILKEYDTEYQKQTDEKNES